MAEWSKITPEQMLRIHDSMDRYNDRGNDDAGVEDPEYWQKQREKREADQVERRRLYTEWLTQALFDNGFLDEQLVAEFVMKQLFDWNRDDSACICMCHPRLGDSDLHGFGFECSCGKTPEDRKASFEQWREKMDEFHNKPEMREWRAEQDRQEDEASEWLATQTDIRDFRELSSACPLQFQFIIANRGAYFRERHDVWRAEIGPQLAEGEEPKHYEDTDYSKGFTSYYDSSEYEDFAEGVADDIYGGTKLDTVKYVVNLYREYLDREQCAHTDARTYCPDCGVKV